MYPGTWQILIIVLLLVLLFGRGKISELMGDVAKGIKSFKRGMSDDEATAEKQNDPKVIDNDPQPTRTATHTETESRKVG